jgi:ATP-binding cassette subfamily B protein
MFKNMKFPLKILNKKKFILCFIDAFLENLCLYLMPVVLSFFTTQPFTLEKLEHLIIAVIVLKIIEIILHHFWLMYILKFEDIYSKDLQLAYFNRVAKMSPYKLNNMHNGFLKKQIDIIADGAANLMESSFETINGFIISIAIFLIEVINQDFKMFWFCLAIIIGIVIYNIWLGRRFIVAQEEYNKSYSKYNSTYVDFLQNIKILKRLSAVKYANSKNEKAFEDVVPKLNRVNICYSLRANVINFVLYFMYVVILINLYFKMKSGDEILSYLLFYATMFSGLNTELRALSKLFMNYNKFQAATNQAENIIGDNVEKDIIYDWKKIQIKDLEFKYDDEAKAPIKIPLFEINRGDKISIVGKSGQGKTTFLNIFSRYIEVDENNYIIDGEKRMAP